VKLRATGTGGTIAVYRVDQNGSETSLYTLDLKTDTEAEVDLRMGSTAEAVALKFVLARDAADATNGPTLLGYQLRALPEPKRQRLIQVPLEVKDMVRRRPARMHGHLKAAWETLNALEQLEESGASVLFRDFRTGESAAVYIESVAFTNLTPPSSGSTGFGGIATLTLRRL
jgi:hypothetical protein